MKNFVVAVPGEHYVWDFYETRQEAERVVNELRPQYPDRAYSVIDDIPGFFEAARATFLTPAVAISKTVFHEALEILPPLQWHWSKGCELFCISEMMFDDITDQYGACRLGGEGGKMLFAKKPVQFKNEETYLTRREIIAANKGETFS